MHRWIMQSTIVDDATSKQANILHRRLQVDKYLFGPFQLHALSVRSSIAGQLDIITLLEQQEKLVLRSAIEVCFNSSGASFNKTS